MITLVAAGWWAYDYLALGRSLEFTDQNGAVNLSDSEQSDLLEGDQPGQSPSGQSGEQSFTMTPFVTNLEVPWDMVFTADNRAVVSERPGRLRVIQDGQLLDEPLHTFTEVSSTAEEGLMGLALDPAYAENQRIYTCYAYPTDTGLEARVIRFVDEGTQISQIETILDALPAARFHAGCRLAFGPDQKLYVTTGDATNREIAQDRSSLGGKILRMNADGSIPDDNPIADSLIYSLGHRNAQGIDWYPPSGQLYSSEHGPSVFDGPAGGDEINVIEPGENYGWPIVSHRESREDLVDPFLLYTPAIAPGSLMIYDGDLLPAFTNNIFVGMLRGEGVLRIVLDQNDPSTILLNEPLPGIEVGRVRTVVEGPDGAIYFMTSNQDGRGTPREIDDAIYQIRPE